MQVHNIYEKDGVRRTVIVYQIGGRSYVCINTQVPDDCSGNEYREGEWVVDYASFKSALREANRIGKVLERKGFKCTNNN